jgi:hypothetical protein
MLEIGLFHNGASSLPVITDKDGITFNKGSLADVHRAAQETLVNQVRQGILAEKLGFQSFWLTEHHFQPEGAEMSPNPLMVQMSVAAHTKHIRLGQAANIIVWHHPVRLAEQIALLDGSAGGGSNAASAAVTSRARTRHSGGPMGRRSRTRSATARRSKSHLRS